MRSSNFHSWYVPFGSQPSDWNCGSIVGGSDAPSITSDPSDAFKSEAPFPPSAAGGTSTTLTAAQIDSVYQSVLGRKASQTEVNDWLTNDASIGDAVVVSAIVNLAEAQQDVYPVVRIVLLATNSVPNAAQLSGWTQYLESAGTGIVNVLHAETQMANAFAGSTFFQNTYGGIAANAPVTVDFMATLIQNATGIAATQTQLDTWVNTGLTVAQVFSQFATGDQYAAATMNKVQTYLTTAADSAAHIPLTPVPTLPFDIRGVKMYTLNMPGEYNDLLGGTLDTSTFIPWKQVIDEVAATGANNVILTINAGVMHNTTDSSFDPALHFSASPEAISKLANLIKADGMSVSIELGINILNVGILDNKAHPADPSAWLQNYGELVLQWAQFSQDIGASAFLPMNDSTQDMVQNPILTQQWVSLLDQVKAKYSGTVTTNWNFGPGNLPVAKAIIDKLDVLGFGFYPKLVSDHNATVQQLENSYHHDVNGNDVIQLLKNLSDVYGKKIWITDKAFGSFDGAAVTETLLFDNSIPLVADQQEQARLYESFLDVMSANGGNWLSGVSFQNFNNIIDGKGNVGRTVDGPFSESPQGKLAESVLSYWYHGGTPHSTQLIGVADGSIVG